MRYLTLLVLPFFLFLTACGGGGNKQSNTTAEGSSSNATAIQANNSSSSVRTIHIYGINKMKYVVKEKGKKIGTGKKVTASNGKSYILLKDIKAKAGQKIHIVLTTISKMPAAGMSHNWILLKQNADAAAFSKAALRAKSNDYIPADLSNQVIAHTGLAAGGETVEVTFTVPDKTGEYPYLCSFPAHYTAGMHGTFIVQ